MIIYTLLILSMSVLPSIQKTKTLQQPGYGYVGPACAVVDGMLFVHGTPKRNLTLQEVKMFYDYQNDVTRYRSGLQSADFLAMDAPLVPSFCGGFDDSVEVVLDSCIVRNNHVYVGDKLIRALDNREKQRLDTALGRRVVRARGRRIKRDPHRVAQRDFSELLHRLLNVNSTVTQRFLPVVSQSPLFNMDGALQTVIGHTDHTIQPQDQLPNRVPNVHDIFSTPSPSTTTSTSTSTTTTSYTRATFKPRRKTAKPYVKKLVTSTTTPRYTFSLTTPRRRVYSLTIPSTTVPPAASPVVPHEETVSDPVILQLIAKALANNELLENIMVPMTSPPRTSVPFHGTPAPVRPVMHIPLNFVTPPPRRKVSWYTAAEPGPAVNLPFAPHMHTSLVDNDSVDHPTPLPNDICTAHLRSNL